MLKTQFNAGALDGIVIFKSILLFSGVFSFFLVYLAYNFQSCKMVFHIQQNGYEVLFRARNDNQQLNLFYKADLGLYKMLAMFQTESVVFIYCRFAAKVT